ncbi:hypothetical protein BD410DRAFT_826672 [Rickenella mellea]|uniref:Cupin type-2 domain-containing protein n=1 Tax=Rickenella mellea TaxID=50990 RepID=A0A4Y7QE11_9AGAM|nr:hypothetical protein BD410DRAFT_826672 [Rickenella mellea]
MSEPQPTPTPAATPLAPIRLVITGHNTSGASTVIEDKVAHGRAFNDKPNSALSTSLFRTDVQKPTNDVDFVESQVKGPVVGEEGSTFSATDLPPHSVTPFHRTISLDYAIVTSGNIICQLNHGVRVPLKAGDVIVQRGTIHAWRNETDEWARIFCTMIASKPVGVAGKTLTTTFFPIE